jgi:hypothetical protein
MNDLAVMVQGCFVKILLIASEKLAREDLSFEMDDSTVFI